ncbi:DENN domain-containing protein 2a-like isoform x2 [Plakobranchus ocellatus]|uniref:DENN domain-containing protein 2a-like isoform x2 n=1 Tax=Plakobranchus ocellatus TaxID=259542 RepID=A0AAV3ZZ05_9GAST|nr:DENN domain-containing protein 2a-like isoform x2 [Plakobranchus ocellatus]
MSDNTDKRSVRQLPPGKLNNLKKLFENEATESPPFKTEKQLPPPRPPLPSTRLKSPERPKLPAGKKPSHLMGKKEFDHAQDSLRPSDSTSRPEDHVSAAVSVRKLNTSKTFSDADQNLSSGQREHQVLSPKISRKIMALTANNSPTPSNSNNAVVKPPPPIKPQGQRKVSKVTDSASEIVIDNPVYEGYQQQESVIATATYSKVNKETKKVGPPSKVSFDQDQTHIQRREAVRRTSGERRKTIASFEPEMDNQDLGSGVNVAMRAKPFEGARGDKPTPPKKSEAVRSMSMRNSREREKQKVGDSNDTKNGPENVYNAPWDTSKNTVFEKLKHSHLIPQSASDPPLNLNKVTSASPHTTGKLASPAIKPPPLPSQPPPKPPAARKKGMVLDSINKPASKSSPMKAPPPAPINKDSPSKPAPFAPPPKPPRTHAHDSYIMTKLSKEVEAKEQSTPQKAVQSAEPNDPIPDKPSSEEAEYFSVKDRVAKMMQLQSSETQTSSPVSKSSPPTPKDHEVNIRQKPPSRPPPPKHRPNSIENNTSLNSHAPPRPQTNCPESKTRSGGPIIIPVFPRRQHQAFQRQSSATYDVRSRKPTDELPKHPDDDYYSSRPLQRFPLRKSRSSECIHSSRGSSINLSSAGTFGDSSGMGDSMSRSAYDYEAVIDSDGYAVPNEFMRLPSNRKDTNPETPTPTNRRPGQFLTKLCGFEASHTPSLSPGTLRDEHKGGKVGGARHDLTKVNKKNMTMVREKINQAYAALDVALRGQADGEEDGWDNSENTAGSRPESQEIVVEPTEMKRRIEYCTSVRLKTSKSIKHTKEYTSAIYPQLFEYCLVASIRPLVDTSGYEPYLIHKFPENVSSNLSVPNFCFPDASIFKPGSSISVSESYSFVMTYSDGSRVYGYCRRIQPPDSSLPEVICIISPIDAFNMYNTLLSEIESRRRISSDLALEVIAASFGRPLPKPGKVCHIRTLDGQGEMETIFLNRPTDNRLDDVNYESPLFYLGTDRLVKVFSSMLMERRIILCSGNLSILTQTVHALSALLYPFHWQHVYVPLLPPEMLDVVCAPMPYIVGVLSAFLPQVLKMDTEQVFIVDLDKKSIVKSQGDESTILPRKVQRALKTAINMCKIDTEAHSAQWLMVAEAFLRMFIEMIGHFPNHVRTQQDGNRIFQKEGFILEMVSKELRQFLEWFTETQMFEVFIVDLVDNPDCWTSDLFMQRLKEHRESKEESNRHKGLGAKVKNFGKALKIKLQAA